MIADEIRNAKTEYEIYFLLASYIEAVRFADKLHCGVPMHVTQLPLHDNADVRERFELLLAELDMASKRLDDSSCTILKEAVYMFGCALQRLGVLCERQQMANLIAMPALQSHAA
jgi:hypothetical protein